MPFKVRDLGRVGFQAGAEIQREVLAEVLGGSAPDTLLLVEHEPVLTLGASFHEANLLLPVHEYESRGIEVVRTDRGGDVTFHGPGQLVIYPIFDVADLGKDLHKWLRDLEETMILVAAAFGLEGRRFPPHTGVWVSELKLAAIGIKMRRWVSMHGIALNCDSNLSAFDLIVPCGIQGYGVTSLSQELGQRVSIEESKPVVVEAFERVFATR